MHTKASAANEAKPLRSMRRSATLPSGGIAAVWFYD